MMSIAQKLARWAVTDLASGCVVYSGWKNRGGYGQVTVGSRKDGSRRKILAHRAAWEDAHGPVPAGKFICHHCDNPACINLDHLFSGSIADNNADMRAKGRHARGTTHFNSRLTPSQVIAIRAATGPHPDIAKIYGVCREHVGAIKRGDRWAHIGVE